MPCDTAGFEELLALKWTIQTSPACTCGPSAGVGSAAPLQLGSSYESCWWQFTCSPNPAAMIIHSLVPKLCFVYPMLEVLWSLKLEDTEPGSAVPAAMAL